jgi:hypothetical protein
MRRNGEVGRSVVAALAAVFAVTLSSLVATPAHAAKPDEGDGSTATAKHRRKKHDAANPGADGPLREKPKASASRAAKKSRKTARKTAPEHAKRPCVAPPITIDRTGLESQSLAVVDCKRQPLEAARVVLSVLARPWGARKPDRLPRVRDAEAAAMKGAEVAPGVRLLDKGLLTRLDAITRRFPGRPISIVSGYRPLSRGSQHQSARALDMRVAGVANEELVAFCKTLRDTGCGYYPNSSFVHVDVRNPGTGGVTWIDASGPGEGPHYVRRWPPPPEDADHAALPIGTAPHDPGADPWAELEDPHPATALGEPMTR